mgnify:CR=1 FL=1
MAKVKNVEEEVKVVKEKKEKKMKPKKVSDKKTGGKKKVIITIIVSCIAFYIPVLLKIIQKKTSQFLSKTNLDKYQSLFR